MTPVPRLLIVDDDLMTLKILQKVLDGMGEVQAVTSGAQALQSVAEHPVDLVLLDIMMPVMDGFATCRTLLQDQPDLAIIFITADTDPTSEIDALEVGGRDFITKPINPAVVRARVAHHLKLRSQYAELKRLEALAQRQLVEIQAYYDTAPVGLFVLDTALRFQRINQHLAEINGHPVEAHLGRTVRELLPDLADHVEPLFQRVIATGEPLLNLIITESGATRPGGQRVWQANYYPLRNAAGDIIGINGFAEDITRRQQIEQNLRDSERRFRDLFKHLPIAYQSLDHEGRWCYANQAMADLLGVETPDALLGRAFSDHWDEATRDQLLAAFATQKPTGGLHGELRLHRRDGSALTAILSGRVEKDETGQFLQTHCVLIDISERRAMEEAIRALNDTLEHQVERRTAELRAANRTLRESEERYRLLFNNIADAIIILDRSGRVLAVNDRACRQYGYRREDFLTLHITDIDVPEDSDKVAGRMAQLEQPGAIAFEAMHRLAGGRVIPVEVRATRIMLDGQPALLGSCHDITARKQAEQAIQRSRADLERAQAIAHLGSWSMDLATHTIEWSKEVYRLFGIESGTPFTYERFIRSVHPDDRRGIESFTPLAIERAPVCEHTFRIMVAGEVKWMRNIVEFEFDENSKLRSMFGTLQDITAQEQARQQIEYLAFYDNLTGLPNRVQGQSRLQQAITIASRQGQGLAVLHLDLNQFKYINDTHGHRVGDRLLQAVAERLSQTLGADDSLCRLSGDEFMLVLMQTVAPGAAPIADVCDRVRTAFASPFAVEDRRLFLTLAIGVALYPQDGGDAGTLMRHANTALFEAKRAGQDSDRFFTPSMNLELMHIVQTRDHLRMALEQGEFALNYQPQIDLHSRRVVGVEALIRWHRPGVGLTLPAHFIAVAEHSGLIVPISQWALREACRQAAAWCDLGWTDCVVAVNLSAVHFRQGQAEQDVMAALEASGLNPANLELELTESLLLDHPEAVIAILSRWKARGIRLSIDDFGTGYSSLAYLKRFKVDKLKIDRSFVTNLQTDAEDCAIIQAIIQIARSLNLRTVAEGVENATQANQLKFIGCDEVQGYFYSEPLPAAELEQWLSEHGCFRRLA